MVGPEQEEIAQQGDTARFFNSIRLGRLMPSQPPATFQGFHQQIHRPPSLIYGHDRSGRVSVRLVTMSLVFFGPTLRPVFDSTTMTSSS